MKDYYICIDIGGTDIKFGVVDANNEILYKSSIKSARVVKEQSFKPAFLEILNEIDANTPYKTSTAKGVGVGFPGLVNMTAKEVKFLPNLRLNDYSSIVSDLQSACSLPIKIANDAELALLAEHAQGAAKNKDNFILLTLGTGLGCGIMINKKPLRQSSPFSCELGHLLSVGGEEEYGSLTSTRALVNQTKKAMQDNPNSKMWSKYNLSTVSGKTVFEFKDSDKTAKQVFDNYIKNLGTIITNLYTLLEPELIVIGGGISKQGENLTKPLEDFVNKNIFIKNIGMQAKVVPAKLSNDAGILGAKCLFN